MKLLAIDALNVVRRIYEAIPGEDSEPKVDAAFKSSMSSFRKSLSTHLPTHAAVVFDHGGRTWRHELFEAYKASRKPMPEILKSRMYLLKQDLRDSGLHSISVPGVEADDVIGCITEKCLEMTDGVVVIQSTDKDFLRLVGERVRVYDPFKEMWRDEAYIQEKFGVSASQMGDFLALRGDDGDGIPGVEKVGDKTAAEWLRIHGSLERIISNADKITGKVGVNLRRDVELARLCRRLVEFKTDIQLGVTWKVLEQRYPG